MTLEKERLSEYERERIKRISENEKMFKQLFPASPPLSKFKRQEGGAMKSCPERRQRSAKSKPYSMYPTRRNPSRHCRGRRKMNYGSDCEEQDRSSDYEPDVEPYEDDEGLKRSGLVVKLWGNKSRSDELSIDRPKRCSKKTVVDREDLFTRYNSLKEDDLVMVASKTSEKNYDQNGTTCHQCRQKTDDLKTLCRSEECFGVKGQFCGPCLKNRYGEDAKTAIMDRSWICPPCRGVCNCSFCMAKKGRRATGILIHLAREKGYESVKAFLGD